MNVPVIPSGFCAVLLMTAAGVALADGPEAGHSQHGEAFNDGPRQAATLLEGMPEIHFPVTTKSPEAQAFFHQGVAQLHGFWYYEAERSFRQVAQLDPECAMACWGIAMANLNTEVRARKFTARAAELKGKASRREQLWIGVLEKFYREDKRDKKTREGDYLKDLEAIAIEFPDDLEARAFLAWRLWHARKEAPIPSVLAADSLLGDVFAKQPRHPAHHYRIHLWDESKPAQALGAAALCGQSSPGIAHMWHMPGHAYSKLKRWEDAVWQQEASSRVDHAHMLRTLVLPDQIHNYAHNQEWLVRNWNELGRARDAIGLSKALIETPRHPALNTLDKGNKSASFGRTRLLETLLKWELWEELAAVASGSPWFEPEAPQIGHEAARLRALAVAQAHLAREDGLVRTRGDLEKLVAREKAEMEKARAEKEKEAKAAPEKPKITEVEKALREAQFLVALLGSRWPEGKQQLAAMAADLPKDRLARYWLRLGETGKAKALLSGLPQDLAGDLVRLEIHLAAKQPEEAKKLFERLRETAAHLDRDLPAARALDQRAALFGVAGGWRKPRPAAGDVGVRPVLASLGPLHWQAPAAPPWSGIGLDGQQVSDADYRGKDTVLVFYLGHQCGHCMEQLTAFAKKAPEFEKAGLRIVALSTDAPGELSGALKHSPTPGKLPFPILSDADKTSFKAWRCHDDFENLALHGVALSDRHGRIRWLDISYEPFTDADFVLREFQRLLRFDLPPLKNPPAESYSARQPLP